MIMETVHTTKASLPAVPAMPPIENSTSAGTPLATQKAPRQSMARCSVFSLNSPAVGSYVVVICSDPRQFFVYRNALSKRKSHAPDSGTWLISSCSDL